MVLSWLIQKRRDLEYFLMWYRLQLWSSAANILGPFLAFSKPGNNSTLNAYFFFLALRRLPISLFLFNPLLKKSASGCETWIFLGLNLVYSEIFTYLCRTLPVHPLTAIGFRGSYRWQNRIYFQKFLLCATVEHTCNTGLAGGSVSLDVLPHIVMLRKAEAGIKNSKTRNFNWKIDIILVTLR